MSILVSIAGISKAFGARPLFENLTFAIESEERIGLIGPNGAGKSTLLRLLAGLDHPDSGVISFQRGLRVGYLEQTPTFSPQATILSTLLEAVKDHPSQEDWEHHARAHSLISQLSLGEDERLVSQLSGGWKKKVALARELMKTPDLLLLDEPTNHLDVESILWLEEFLAQARFATLTITHDRAFLQKVSRRILELDRRNPGGLLSVQGDYAQYLETKSQMMAAQERREVILKNTLRRETEWLRRGAKARTTKQQARIQRAETLKNEVGELEVRNQSRSVQIDFQGASKNPKKLIEAQKVSCDIQGKTLFSQLDLILTPGTRLGILGPNGCGKSTLVRTLAGLDQPSSGSIYRSENLSIAYFEQNREALDPELSVMRTLCPTGDSVTYRGERVHIRSYLDRFLFSAGQMEMAVGKLSGGEQSRLLIAQLMLNPANLLILDEPTNDLDMATLSILEDCLVEFPGAVILVTHDRYFLDQVTTQILAFDTRAESPDQRIQTFSDLFQWESWLKQQSKLEASSPKKQEQVQAQVEQAPATKDPSKRKKLSYKDQRELDSMESVIHDKEKRLAQLTEQSLLPENASRATQLLEITREMESLHHEIDQLYVRWAELEAMQLG